MDIFSSGLLSLPGFSAKTSLAVSVTNPNFRSSLVEMVHFGTDNNVFSTKLVHEFGVPSHHKSCFNNSNKFATCFSSMCYIFGSSQQELDEK
jgi:hypothetical protein